MLIYYYLLCWAYISFHTEFQASSLPRTTRFWWGCDCDRDCHCDCDGGKQSQILVFWTWLGLEFDKNHK